MVPVSTDVGDLGVPLGWVTQGDGTLIPEPAPQGPLVSTRAPVSDIKQDSPLTAGKLVVLMMEPDEVENLPFAVGEVISIDENRLTVWWYGPKNSIRGEWRPGYYEPTGRRRRYYSERRHHTSHPRYTSVVTETVLTISDVVGPPFDLTPSGRLPTATLDAIAECENVPWP